MSKRVRVVGSATRFDERRNTSRVFRPPPDALPNALRALESCRRDQPQLCAWIDAGAPPIRSDDDHRRWFGSAYEQPKPRRA